MTQSIWERIANEIQSFTSDIRDLPVSPDTSPAEIRSTLEGKYAFESPVSLDELTKEVMTYLREWTVHVTHPRYFGLFNPGVRQAGIVADTLAALYNPQLAVWSHAPAAIEIERHTLNKLTGILGFPQESTFSNFTTGGAEANLSALLSSIAKRFPETGESGIGSLSVKPAIYLTGESHHSFVKIARMTGLGVQALRKVSTNDRHLFSASELRTQIEKDMQSGSIPLMIVGTAGTTGAGLIDPLHELADVAAEFDTWFHVDAAWGASALLSSSLRESLKGIESADSVTWDAHKWLSVPMGAGMFFCRHPQAVAKAFAIETSYMPGQTGEGTADPYRTTAQWSRRAIGLKVFMSIAEIGFDGYENLINHQTAIGDQLRELLKKAGWLVTNDTPLPVVCFTHPDIRKNSFSTSDLLSIIHDRSNVWISDVIVGEKEHVLRACITSFRTDESDLQCLVNEIEIARSLLVSK